MHVWPQRKTPEPVAGEAESRLSLVRFERKNYRITPISRTFQSNPGHFLCTSDSLVERAEIELVLEVYGTCKSRHVLELHLLLQHYIQPEK
jgi:hypothetical protein